MRDALDVCVGHEVLASAILRNPLVRARGTLAQFPLEAEQCFQEAVVPFRRVRLPGAFEAAGDRVLTLAGAERTLPTKAQRVHRATFRLRTHEAVIAGTVRLTKGVTAGDQCDRLFVVHRHASECLADVARCKERIGVAVRSLGIDVDQAHLHRAERVGKRTIAGVALVAQP